MSDFEFKQRLLTIVNNDLHRKDQIQQLFNANNALTEIGRQRSCLISNIYSTKIEQDFWKSYQTETRIEFLWLSKMNESMLESNNISKEFLKNQRSMSQNLKYIEKRLPKNLKKLDDRLQEREEEEEFLQLSTADKSLLTATILALVRQDQPKLRNKYEKKHSQLMLNVNDIRLVKQFYDLKPDEMQLSLLFLLLKSY